MKSGVKFAVCMLAAGLMTFFPSPPAGGGDGGGEAAADHEPPTVTAPTEEVPESISLEEALSAYYEGQYQEPSLPPQDFIQVACTNGLMNYYNQGDPRWADSLYGPSDRIGSSGCGPTALAMIVSSFTNYDVTPLDTAKWAGDNGYCSPGEGSRHSLIPEGLSHYGLEATPLTDRSPEAVLNQIRNGKIVIALMDKGYFTKGGHFLLLTRVTDDGQLWIADPASWENSNKTWEPEFILNQIRSHAESGGPLWTASLPPEM